MGTATISQEETISQGAQVKQMCSQQPCGTRPAGDGWHQALMDGRGRAAPHTPLCSQQSFIPRGGVTTLKCHGKCPRPGWTLVWSSLGHWEMSLPWRGGIGWDLRSFQPILCSMIPWSSLNSTLVLLSSHPEILHRLYISWFLLVCNLFHILFSFFF